MKIHPDKKGINVYMDKHAYLITGTDFPLKSQNEILRFYDDHKKIESISCGVYPEKFLERIQYYHFFQDFFVETKLIR